MQYIREDKIATTKGVELVVLRSKHILECVLLPLSSLWRDMI